MLNKIHDIYIFLINYYTIKNTFKCNYYFSPQIYVVTNTRYDTCTSFILKIELGTYPNLSLMDPPKIALELY